MKKLLCILLALSLLVMLAGCVEPAKKDEAPQQNQAQETTEPVSLEVNNDNISGTWTAELDLSEFLTMELAEYEQLQMGLLVMDFYVTVNMEFRENGTYKVWLEKETLDASVEVLMETIEELLWQDLEMMYMDPLLEMELEEVLAKEGVDPDKDLENIRQQLLTDGYVGKLQGRIDREGKYQIAMDELYLSDSLDEDVNTKVCDLVELTSSTLTFIENYGELESDGYLLYPLTFQRVQ